jgi:hypothetical protein
MHGRSEIEDGMRSDEDEDLTFIETVIQASSDAATEHLERMAGGAHLNKKTLVHYKDYLVTTISVAKSTLAICRRIVSARVSADGSPLDESTRVVQELIAGMHESVKAMHFAICVVEQLAVPPDGPDSPRRAVKPPEESHGARRCSFCGIPETETNVVAGPEGNICASCTRLACAMLGIGLQETDEE